MTTESTALLAHIRNLNAKTLEWVAAGEGRFSTTIVEDVEFWAESGVHTVEDFIKYDLATEIYEITKSAYGYRENWGKLMELETSELQVILANLQKSVRAAAYAMAMADSYHEEEQRHDDWMTSVVEDRYMDLAEAAGY